MVRSNDKTGTFFIGAAKSYLASAKGLTRLLRDYNQLIGRFNSSSRICARAPLEGRVRYATSIIVV